MWTRTTHTKRRVVGRGHTENNRSSGGRQYWTRRTHVPLGLYGLLNIGSRCRKIEYRLITSLVYMRSRERVTYLLRLHMDVTKVLERTPYNELSYVNELEGKEQDETTNKDLCQR